MRFVHTAWSKIAAICRGADGSFWRTHSKDIVSQKTGTHCPILSHPSIVL